MVLGSHPVAVTSPSDFAPALSKEFLDIQATIECEFTNIQSKNLFKGTSKQEKNIANKNSIPTIWIQLPYVGSKGEHLLKQCIRKVKCSCTTNIKFVVLHKTKKISYFCTVKDKISIM